MYMHALHTCDARQELEVGALSIRIYIKIMLVCLKIDLPKNHWLLTSMNDSYHTFRTLKLPWVPFLSISFWNMLIYIYIYVYICIYIIYIYISFMFTYVSYSHFLRVGISGQVLVHLPRNEMQKDIQGSYKVESWIHIRMFTTPTNLRKKQKLVVIHLFIYIYIYGCFQK